MLQLSEVFKFLVDNGYILASKSTGYSLSKSFQAAVKNMKKGEIIVPGPEALVAAHSAELNWPNLFVQFIQDAKVPPKLSDNKGGQYAANKYSEDAMKKFKQMMESGIDYNILVKSTILYYASGITYKKAIGNYITQGDWRTDYFLLKGAAEKGVDELAKHVQEETKNGEHTNYTIG